MFWGCNAIPGLKGETWGIRTRPSNRGVARLENHQLRALLILKTDLDSNWLGMFDRGIFKIPEHLIPLPIADMLTADQIILRMVFNAVKMFSRFGKVVCIPFEFLDDLEDAQPGCITKAIP